MVAQSFITASAFLLVTSISFSSAVLTTNCYWQDGTLANDYNTPCANDAGDAFVCCPAATMECTTTNVCQVLGTTQSVITQGACTDQNWDSPSCAKRCPQDGDKPVSLTLCPCNRGNCAPSWCCGTDCCSDTTKFSYGSVQGTNAPIADAKQVASIESAAASSSSAKAAATKSASTKSKSSTTASSKTGSTSASTTSSLDSKSTDGSSSQSSGTNTSSPTSTDSSPASSSSSTTPSAASSPLSTSAKAGIAIGILGIVAVISAMGFVFWQRRRRQSSFNESRIAALEMKTTGSTGFQTLPGGSTSRMGTSHGNGPSPDALPYHPSPVSSADLVMGGERQNSEFREDMSPPRVISPPAVGPNAALAFMGSSAPRPQAQEPRQQYQAYHPPVPVDNGPVEMASSHPYQSPYNQAYEMSNSASQGDVSPIQQPAEMASQSHSGTRPFVVQPPFPISSPQAGYVEMASPISRGNTPIQALTPAQELAEARMRSRLR